MYVNCKYLQCIPWRWNSWIGLFVDCSTLVRDSKRFHDNFMACLDMSEKQMFNAHFMNGLHVAWFLLQFGNWRKRHSKGQLQHHQQCFPINKQTIFIQDWFIKPESIKMRHVWKFASSKKSINLVLFSWNFWIMIT